VVDQITELPHVISVQMLPMVVVTLIDIDGTTPEVLLQHVQHIDALRALHYSEAGLDLPTKS
ncbi:MAG TPA: hypothetical protein VHJ34_00225, partial [Actinomycetota bacterium]|nr:hypothetical protein [Actinomycetota bacterium]